MIPPCECGNAYIGPWRRGQGWCSLCWRRMNPTVESTCCGGSTIRRDGDVLLVPYVLEGESVMRWAYGVTTVPRRRDLFERTLGSLRDAGFEQPRLFLDGGTHREAQEYEDRYQLPVTARNPALKVFGNWVLTLAELYIRNPQAHRFVVFQDDFVTYRNLRDYLTRVRMPDKGYWNLYTFPQNQAHAPKGKVGFYRTPHQDGRGAVALVFTLAGVQALLGSHAHIIERPTDVNKGTRNVDGAIVSALRKQGWVEYCHNPSLVQHMGVISTMMRSHDGQERATSFRGEDFDAMDLFKEEMIAANA